MTNPNVEAGEALRQHSARLTEYKQRGETLIRDPLAELQRIRGLFKRIRRVWVKKVDVYFYQGIKAGKAIGRIHGAVSLLAARKKINVLRQERDGLRIELKRVEDIALTQGENIKRFMENETRFNHELYTLRQERDAFIAKLAQARAECDEMRKLARSSADDVLKVCNDLRQCQHERDELRARLNAVRRAAGDV